jgi:N-acyl-D-aspartate/D-glutamate deacylase
VVAPGFVDVHTHYDGQAMWDSRLQPSSWHGVTTVVMGNCGVGFAPVAPQHRVPLLQLMEGVEDLPGTVLHEGLDWQWESFGEYLSALTRRPHDVDIATQVPHAALRFAAMGERAAAYAEATGDEIAEMARLAREAIEAGALGFTTSRTLKHKSSEGSLTPVYGSPEPELAAIAAEVGRTGRGVLQLITDWDDIDSDFALMRDMVRVSGRPLSVSLFQYPDRPEFFREVLARAAAASSDGLPIRVQVASRGVGALMGLQCTRHTFVDNRVWQTIRHLSPAEQAARMAQPEMRAAILRAEMEERATRDPSVAIYRFDLMYELGARPNYEPLPGDSIGARAERAGRDPAELVYDLLIADEGRRMIQQPFLNFGFGNLDAVHEMLTHSCTIPGLGDGGAHAGILCDASFPTTLLQHWVRDRGYGRLDLADAVKRQARDTARAVGLDDRGVLAPGFKADVNVIDLDNLTLHSPVIVNDLPAGGRRLLQRADGYLHTFVAGAETYRDGEPTDALPGTLIRGPQPRPAAAA